MAKTSFVEIPAGMEDAFFKILSPGDRFYFSRLRRNNVFISRKRKKALTLKSLLPQIASTWAALTTPEKEAWESAAAVMGLHGYKLFTADHSARLKEEIAGVATPSLLHQGKVGKLQVSSPADGMLIAQFHPSSYYIQRKIRGKKQYESVITTEFVSLPFVLSLSYRSNLVAIDGMTPRVRLYATIISLYQGRQIENELEINLALSSGWTRPEVTLSDVQGRVNGYTLYIEIEGARGWLEFDNVKAYHTGQNWVRDPWCNNINQAFTKAWFQVPKHWAAIDLPSTAFYASDYPLD